MSRAILSPPLSDAGYKAAKFGHPAFPLTLAPRGPLLYLAHILCSGRVEDFLWFFVAEAG